MGFRNEEEARAHRIHALETELSERNRKIAELEAKLEGQKEPPRKRQKRGARGGGKKDVPKVADVPEGDLWTLPVHQPLMWLVGLAWVAVTMGIGGYLHLVDGMAWSEVAPAMLACFPALFLFHRRRLVLDKRAGTVTQQNRLLIATWTRATSYRGQSIRVERRHYSPKDGAPHWNGHVFLGKMKLFAMREEPAIALARRVAAFLEIPCRVVTPSHKQMQRQAMLPLLITFGVAAPLVLAAWFIREFLLR